MTVYLWLPHENMQEGILAADRRRSKHRLVSTKTGKRKSNPTKTRHVVTHKLNMIGPHVTYVCSGPVAYRMRLREMIESDAETDPIGLFGCYERRLRRLINTRLSDAFSYLTVFSGMPGEDRLHTFAVRASDTGRVGIERPEEMVAGGSGAPYAREYAESRWSPNLPLEESAAIAYEAILFAGTRDQKCKHADVARITMHEARIIKRS